MNSLLKVSLILNLAFTTAGLGGTPNARHYFVAFNGNNAWSGKRSAPNPDRSDGPFASLERARDEIRQLKRADGLPPGGVVVELRAGLYEREQPFALTAEDSGSPEAPIVYRAYAGEEARLVGGKVVSGFTPVTDPAVLSRLAEVARGKVLQADLRAMGVTNYGSAEGGGLELFFHDRPMTLARWPNEGFVKIVDLAGGEPFGGGTKGDQVGKFTYGSDRARRWVGEKDAWLHGYWFFDWRDQRLKIASIDTERDIITLGPVQHGGGYRQGQPFYAFNLLAELDLPGEWYLDRETGILYFWPPDPIEAGKTMVSLWPVLVTMTEVSHVTLQGLILEVTRDTAVVIGGGTQNQILGCTIRNVADWAVWISGGTEHSVVGCDICETGSGGISLDGGDRDKLIPARNRAENNHIHHVSRWSRVYRPAILLRGGVGNIVVHNLIHDTPHQAISFTGNDHLIEFNEIHSVCYESNDAGAIYSGRNWTWRGTVIRHNYFHHFSGFEGRGCVGIYLDDLLCGTTIYGNLFYRVRNAAFIGGGRDNLVENNVFIDCRPALHVDGRGMGWPSGEVDEGMRKGLLAVPYQKPPWSERYPALVNLLENHPGEPKGNVIARNVCQGGTWTYIVDPVRPFVTFTNNLVNLAGEGKDPRFVDAANLSFQLREDSPAYALGFKRIPIEQMGLYQDRRRASWPVVHPVRPVLEPIAVKGRPGDAARRQRYFIAVNGNDAWSGTLLEPNPDQTDGPFASLERARAQIRRLKKAEGLPTGGVVVEVRGGIYERIQPFALILEDSGNQTSPVVYRAYPGEEVRLAGGKVVKGFKPVTDLAVLNRLEEAARGKVLQADLRAMGITNFGSVTGGGLELYFQGKPMTLARWPNEGFAKIADFVDGESFVDGHGVPGNRIGKFTYGSNRAKRWVGEKEAWVYGSWFFDWRNERQKVGAVEDAGRVIAIAPPYHGGGYRQGQPFYGFNILAELDRPEEWYLDRELGILYFWPPGPIEEGKPIVSLSPGLITMNGVWHVTVRGMILEAARDNAIEIFGGAGNQIVGCTIRSVGGWALWFGGGIDNGVVGCDIYETGQGGIGLNGGDRRTLTPANLYADNNHIHHFSRWNLGQYHQAGISLKGVGNRATHNLIHDAPHNAIAFLGNDHLIEFNEIYRTCYTSNDGGAIGTGGDWSLRGTLIRYNYLHHLEGYEGRGCVGIYLDNMGCGTTIYGNIFYRVKGGQGAVFIGGGKDNIVENNIFVACLPAMGLDARAMGWTERPVDEGMKKMLEAMPYQKPPWSERYPQLVHLLEEDTGLPRGNMIVRNVCQDGKWDEIADRARAHITVKDNLTDVMYGDENPRFIDAAHGNFQLQDDSAAYQLGFKRIPIEQIGLYQDARRASWPVLHQARPMRDPVFIGRRGRVWN